jgi:uncharacterized protein (TIGR02284 family)
MSATNTTEAIDILRDLAEINVDSAKGFEMAAGTIKDVALAGELRELGKQRQRFADQLLSRLSAANESPKESGSVKGLVHRWWLELRNAVSNTDNFAVLAEAERGEDEIKHRYEDALSKAEGLPIHSFIAEQYQAIKAGHDRIRDLREQYRTVEK